MALDEALMERARCTGEAVLRVYGWSRPTLSLGRNQAARQRYDEARARALGVDIVRRPTGGRAVLHFHEVTYSVTAPVAGLGPLGESYRWVNRLLVDGLRRLGVEACEAESSGRAPRPGVSPCFEQPVAGEIVAGGRKLVGSAQYRERDALLQHGSILLDDDQWLASALLLRPVTPPPPPATLRTLLGRAPSVHEVARALCDALEAAAGAPPSRFETDPPLAAAASGMRARYDDRAWTWRL
jgi:lipoate-protein ligase A